MDTDSKLHKPFGERCCMAKCISGWIATNGDILFDNRVSSKALCLKMTMELRMALEEELRRTMPPITTLSFSLPLGFATHGSSHPPYSRIEQQGICWQVVEL